MDTQPKKRVLVVANRTAATPRLLEVVSQRRKQGPCEFALLIPDVTDRKRADWTLENAVPMLQRAAGGPVEGLIGGADPFSSVQDAVRDGRFDSVETMISSKFPSRTAFWTEVNGSAPPTRPSTGPPAARASIGTAFSSVQSAFLRSVTSGMSSANSHGPLFLRRLTSSSRRGVASRDRASSPS